MAKTDLVIKNINALFVNINLLLISPKANPRKYPSCPVCDKSAFLHHDYDDYPNYRRFDKKCNHSFFQSRLIV